MRFMAMWATQMAMGANLFGQALGREVTADDLEPVNWVQVEHARRLTAVDLATHRRRCTPSGAGCSSGGRTAGTCS